MIPLNSLEMALLGRLECHLCEEAEIVVRKVYACLSLPWEKINIENHPDLHDRYKEEITVLLVDGRKLFKYRTNEPDLMKSLSRRLSSWSNRRLPDLLGFTQEFLARLMGDRRFIKKPLLLG